MKKTLILILFSLGMFISSFGQTISRGPYLQLRTNTGIEVHFSTNTAALCQVRYGLSSSNLNLFVDESGVPQTRHRVALTSLQPDTKYFYGIYSGGNLIEASATNYFVTSSDTQKKIHIWATGDCGTGYQTQYNVLNAFSNYVGNQNIDAWLLLGDNAYVDGKESEYQSNFFNVYQSHRLMKQTNIYAAPGNHDYYAVVDGKVNKNVPYFDIFKAHKNGEAGGVPSNQKEYYSYNIGNVHFLSLDSYGVETAARLSVYDTLGSPQVQWIKQDLAANIKPWTIVYFHHPPYSKGSHDTDLEIDLVKMRTQLMPILERYNVDIVLSGHSHLYERSKLIKGHFGLENTYNSTIHAKSTSSANYDGTTNSCPYVKSTDGSKTGTIYCVAGSAGKLSGTTAGYPHNAMHISDFSQGGSLYMVVEGNRLDAKFIREDGSILDKFTMFKNTGNTTRIVQVPQSDEPIELESPYYENAFWNSGTLASDKFILLPTGAPQTVQVSDTKNCFNDTFNIIPITHCFDSKTILGTNVPGANYTINARNFVNANVTIPNTVNYTIKAGKAINIGPGFISSPNQSSRLSIGIQSCD
ncbi:MAG: metallophosphoesterase [Leadbetterella sp.]